jgi:hypothetical protein
MTALTLQRCRIYVRTRFTKDNILKKLSIIVAALAFTTAAKAEPPNNTPHALACMKKYGFTHAQWRAYTVPAEKAEPYRRCRDGKG